MAYSFKTPKLILSGHGSLDELVMHLSGHGHKALIIAGKSAQRSGVSERVSKILDGLKIGYAYFGGITSEPDDVMISEGVKTYKEEECDMLIAIGGGSQIDAMKAVALLSVSGRSVKDHAGSGAAPAEIAPLPFMTAIPTTSGTGSEVTKFTVVTVTKTGEKVLIKDDRLIPDIACLDPALTLSMPERVTISTGMDALTHAIESYTSKHSQPLSDSLAVSAVKKIYENIGKVVDDPDDPAARAEMQEAAMEAGLSFGNSSTTLVHGMSRPIGAHFHVPHGLANAMLLPACLGFIKEGVVQRFAELGRAVGAAMSVNSDDIAARRFVESARLLCMKLKVPSLEQYGIDKEVFMSLIDKMTEEALESGTPQNTVREVTAEDIKELYRSLWPEQITMDEGILPAE